MLLGLLSLSKGYVQCESTKALEIRRLICGGRRVEVRNVILEADAVHRDTVVQQTSLPMIGLSRAPMLSVSLGVQSA